MLEKLTSRKLWAAIVGVITGLVLAFGADAETIETVSGAAMTIVSCVAYIIGEAAPDAARAKSDVYELVEDEGGEE